jgi:hypothetical protein
VVEIQAYDVAVIGDHPLAASIGATSGQVATWDVSKAP